MSKYNKHGFWYYFTAILMTLVVLAGLFCLVVAIAGLINNVSFVEQFKTWFKIAKPVVDETKDVISTGLRMLK